MKWNEMKWRQILLADYWKYSKLIGPIDYICMLLVVAIYKFINIACEIKLKNEATNSTFSKKLSENFELIHWFFNFIANLLSYQPSYFLSACATWNSTRSTDKNGDSPSIFFSLPNLVHTALLDFVYGAIGAAQR